MRTYHWISVLLGAAAFPAAWAMAGCNELPADCPWRARCGSDGGGPSTSTTGTSTGGHGGGGNGGTGGSAPGCVPGEDPTSPVGANCGVFVSVNGKDGDAGTQDAPVQTIAHALALAKGKPVYACAGATPFNEALSVPAGAVIYGGLDCSSWKYIGDKTKTEITADAGKIPLTLKVGPSATELFDLYVSAGAASGLGGSSIAVVVDQATVAFTRCTFVAQDASDGEAGTSGGDQEAQAEGGKVGGNAGVAGMGDIAGGIGGNNIACSLKGGNGGDGGTIPNGNAQGGAPGDSGSGAPGTGAETCGVPNPNGANGMAGPFGSAIQGPGTIDSTGYHGVDGLPGVDGTNGTSGGGGGGSKATASAHGAGGGGGGAGGCAGKLGTGGKAGGSSIALLSLDAKVTLTACKLSVGKGGDGGDGGDGQFGQGGGKGGDGGNLGGGAGSGCAGGKGGDGGNGGNGSGALGGHSLGIALTGTAPTLDDATKKASHLGVPGTGGKGGQMNVDMNHGPTGNAGICWDFSKNTACAK